MNNNELGCFSKNALCQNYRNEIHYNKKYLDQRIIDCQCQIVC